MKKESPHAVLEEAGVAFDPGSQHMDLSKEEKRRTTSMLLAIQAYQGLIIKDAEMLREVSNQARTNEGLKIQPATIDAIVEAALKFDSFISGSTPENTGQTAGFTSEAPAAEPAESV